RRRAGFAIQADAAGLPRAAEVGLTVGCARDRLVRYGSRRPLGSPLAFAFRVILAARRRRKNERGGEGQTSSENRDSGFHMRLLLACRAFESLGAVGERDLPAGAGAGTVTRLVS